MIYSRYPSVGKWYSTPSSRWPTEQGGCEADIYAVQMESIWSRQDLGLSKMTSQVSPASNRFCRLGTRSHVRLGSIRQNANFGTRNARVSKILTSQINARWIILCHGDFDCSFQLLWRPLRDAKFSTTLGIARNPVLYRYHLSSGPIADWNMLRYLHF